MYQSHHLNTSQHQLHCGIAQSICLQLQEEKINSIMTEDCLLDLFQQTESVIFF